MEIELTKATLEAMRPRIASALSRLRVPRSDCEMFLVGEPHYPGWELRFRLRLNDDPEGSLRGHLLVRVSVVPFFPGNVSLEFALTMPNGDTYGGSVPPVPVDSREKVIAGNLVDLFHEFDPEAWPVTYDDESTDE